MSASRTAAVVERVARWRRAGHPASPAAAGTLGSGAGIPESLAAAGAHPGVIALAGAAKPSDVDGFLESLAQVLGRAEDRRRALQEAAAYPALLAASGMVLATVLAVGVRPAAGVIAGADTGAFEPPPLAPTLVALVLSASALAYLALALRADPPVLPFAGAKRRQDRALLLGSAACAAAHGAPLDSALRASAACAASPRMREELEALASALSSGARLPAAPRLLGALGGSLFAVASAGGEGAAALAALADAAEGSAAADVPNQVLRAEVISLVIAAASVALAGIGIYQSYSAALAAL